MFSVSIFFIYFILSFRSYLYLISFIFFSLSGLTISPLQASLWGDGYLSVPGRPVSLDNGRARAYCACSRCGWGLFVFFLSPIIFLSLLSLRDGWMDDVILRPFQ